MELRVHLICLAALNAISNVETISKSFQVYILSFPLVLYCAHLFYRATSHRYISFCTVPYQIPAYHFLSNCTVPLHIILYYTSLFKRYFAKKIQTKLTRFP